MRWQLAVERQSGRSAAKATDVKMKRSDGASNNDVFWHHNTKAQELLWVAN